MKKSTQKKNKKILVFISNGLGEVEFIYPYFSLINTNNLDIKFLYLEKLIFQKAMSDPLWSTLIKQKNYKTEFLKSNIYNSKIGFFFNVYRKIFSYIKLVWNILLTDIIIIDYGQIRAKFCNIARFHAILLNKKIIAMPHTSNADYLFNINEVPSLETRKTLGYNSSRDKETLMSLDSYSYSYNYHFLNFSDQIFVGNPRRNKKFISYVKSIDHKYRDFVLYCSYYTNKKLFNIKNKEVHFINAYNIIREFYPYKKIVVTMHPRENINEIISLIKKYKCENIEISNINSLLLSKDAVLTIGTLTSATLCPLYFGLNAINYWENEDKYLPSVGHSHPLKFLNIKHARNNIELREFIRQHTNGIRFTSEFFKSNHNEIKNIFN